MLKVPGQSLETEKRIYVNIFYAASILLNSNFRKSFLSTLMYDNKRSL